MLCEKCGKNNSDSVTVCKHCGALMPQRASNGGFSDILNYEAQAKAMSASAAPTPTSASGSGVDAARLVYLERQIGVLQAARKKAEKAFLVAVVSLVVALGVGVFALINSCSGTAEKTEPVPQESASEKKEDEKKPGDAGEFFRIYFENQKNEYDKED